MSSMSAGWRPTSMGPTCLSTAEATAWKRWVNVAQPRPNRPGSDVSTRTTTSRMPSGAVTIDRTAVIVSLSRAGHGACVCSITDDTLRGGPLLVGRARARPDLQPGAVGRRVPGRVKALVGAHVHDVAGRLDPPRL